MAKFKQYTKEQEQRIQQLRLEAEQERLKRKQPVYVYNPKTFYKEADRVFVEKDSETLVGYVLAVTPNGYTISTPYGIMKKVQQEWMRPREYQDLSHVVIPEGLKAIGTAYLVSMLRSMSYGYYDGYCKYSIDEIRAELRLRPNIRNKRGKKVVKKYSK